MGSLCQNTCRHRYIATQKSCSGGNSVDVTFLETNVQDFSGSTELFLDHAAPAGFVWVQGKTRVGVDAEICTEDNAPPISEETVMSSHSQGLVYNSFRVGSLFSQSTSAW